MDRAETETALCRALSGFDDVSARFAAAGMARVSHEFGDDVAGTLRRSFETGGTIAVGAERSLDPPVEQLLMFLYTGFTDTMRDDEGVPEDHFESLMWRAVQAHPPALSGGYFGHWHYPPEDRP